MQRSPLLRRAFAADSTQTPAASSGDAQPGGAAGSAPSASAEPKGSDSQGQVAKQQGFQASVKRKESEHAGALALVAKGTALVRKLVLRVVEMCRSFIATCAKLAKAFVKNPRVVRIWYKDIRDATVHFCKWVSTGFRLFWQDIRTAAYLTKRVFRGYPLTVRERKLLVRTTSDCLKLIPFSFFLIVPFAEVLLPFALRLFPNMLPSTFFDKKVDEAKLARRFKAKQEMAEFWQQVVEQRTKEITKLESHAQADKAEELREFQAKLLEAKEFPTLKEILRFSKFFAEQMLLDNLNNKQLATLSRLLGLRQSSWSRGFNEVQLRHHIVSIRQEDRDFLWEGIDSLTRAELIEACAKRAIRVAGREDSEMAEDLNRWLELSSHREIPTACLLWVQSFYLVHDDLEAKEAKESLQMEAAPPPKQSAEEEDEGQEAFINMAERQKAKTENLQRNLEELRQEIEEVVDKPAGSLTEPTLKVEDVDARTTEARTTVRPPGIASSLSVEEEPLDDPDDWTAERKQRAKLLKRLREIDDKRHLYKEVMSMQKTLLDHQLEFLNSMRQNVGCQQRDPDTILLDQRVRLMEMIGKFEDDYEAIDSALATGKPARKPRVVRLQ